MTNPYTHLRTLLDDESRHRELDDWMSLAHGFNRYTTNLDALIPLWEPLRRTLSGWRVRLVQETQIGDSWACFARCNNGGNEFMAWRKTPALAMLDCLLQVLQYEWGTNATE